MTTIYLVRGCQADYSERWEWVTGGWGTKEAAEAEAKRLREAMLALKPEEDYWWNPFEHEDEIKAVDPESSGWSWPPSYNVIEVPFHA